jgi:flagellar biosynthesis protein FliR
VVIISLAQVQLFFLAFVRIMVMLSQVPVLGGRTIPNEIRVAFGLVLTVVLLPWQPLSADAPPMPVLVLAGALVRELIVGLLAGFSARLVFGALQTGGELMGLVGGFSSGRILNPAFESSSTALDQFLLLTATLIFLILNGHHLFLLGVQRTFVMVPLNSALPEFSLDRVLILTQQLIQAAVLLALPVVGTALITDVVLGLLARVAPQVQIFFLEAPLKAGVSVLALILAFRSLAPALASMVQAIGPRMIWLLGG